MEVKLCAREAVRKQLNNGGKTLCSLAAATSVCVDDEDHDGNGEDGENSHSCTLGDDPDGFDMNARNANNDGNCCQSRCANGAEVVGTMAAPVVVVFAAQATEWSAMAESGLQAVASAQKAGGPYLEAAGTCPAATSPAASALATTEPSHF
eukprot:6208443-Pleurochrysis_carterae.AAC.2